MFVYNRPAIRSIKHTIVCLLCFTLLLLSGCLPKQAPPLLSTLPLTQPPLNREQALNQMNAFTVQGVIAFNEGSQHQTASLTWRHENAQTYTMRLYGPFGAGAIELSVNPTQAMLKSNQHPTPIVATEAYTLLKQETGWALPVNNLYFWVRGLAAPYQAASLSKDNQQRLMTLTQGGWTLHYLNYTTRNGLDLPRTISLSEENITIKLVIKNWIYSARP